MAPRSIADATRFTPTGPHAFTSPNDRVAALREQARQKKAEKAAGTLLDRAIDRGRGLADVAHRATAVGLILATVACAGITVYAITDMMMFNRRRKVEFMDEAKRKREIEAAAIAAAVEMGQPEAVVLAERREMERPKGPWEKFKGWAMSGMTPAEKEYKTAFEKETEREAVGVRKGDELVKRDPPPQQGSSGVLSSVTGWWSGK